MRKYLYILPVLISLLFVGCGKEEGFDDKENEQENVAAGTFKYEASVDNPDMYNIIVTYVDENEDTQQKLEAVPSPFVYEGKDKLGNYYYISVAASIKPGMSATVDPKVTCKIYIDGQLVKESTDTNATVALEILQD